MKLIEETPIGLEAKEMGVVDASKAYKVLKKLLEENVGYEDGLKTIKQHIKDKVRKSFEVDWGISDKLSDRLMTETVVELQIIEQMIDDILEGKEDKDGNR